MIAANLHLAWAQLLLRSLARSGVRDVVVSPGSRSTPLALAAHTSPELRCRFVLDERSAAFFALGQARVTGRPTVLVCTSGTAAAHYYPAVIEASMSALPLIAITADRPWEMQNTGASQTIDQTRLYGDFARGYFALGAPEPTEAALRALVRTAAQAAFRARGPLAGPVQINAPFRKPLEPVTTSAILSVDRDAADRSPADRSPADRSPADRSRADRSPADRDSHAEQAPWIATWEMLMQLGPTRSVPSSGFLDPAAFEECARLVARAERGLIVCGPAPAHGDLDAYRREMLALARLTGFPILAEATSQVRFGLPLSTQARQPLGDGGPTLRRSLGEGDPTKSEVDPRVSPLDAPVVVSFFDALLRSPAFRARMTPDVILEIGAPPTSAGYAQLLADNPRCPRFVVASPGWTDPTSTATSILHADLSAFRAALRVHMTGLPEGRGAAWSRAFVSMDARAAAAGGRSPDAGDAVVEECLSPPAAPVLTEAAVARAVIEACPPDSTLVLGNSSPVRDIDAYCPASMRSLRVLHQRGASGIDGLISGAAGALVASGDPVTLLLGDLSFLHDLGGLAVARGVYRNTPGTASGTGDGGRRRGRQALVGVRDGDGDGRGSGDGDGNRSGDQDDVRGSGDHDDVRGSGEGDRRSWATPALVIVVVNNGGGRIFEQLPIARAIDAETFERCFATPEPLDFAAAAATFGLGFERATTPQELATALHRAHSVGGRSVGTPSPSGGRAHAVTLVEAVVDPHEGARRLRDLWSSTARIPAPPRDSETNKIPDKS